MVARITPTERKLSAATSDKGRLQRACVAKLKEHLRDGALSTNGRFIFYELEQDGVVPKHYPDKKRTPDQDISEALMWLREKGVIPWAWIVDETRNVSDWDSAPTIVDYLKDVVGQARINPWRDELPPLIICEARSTKGVLAEKVAYLYVTPITATNGQCGGFLVTKVAPLLIGNDRRVLYIGDHEIGGPADSIEANTRRYLERHADRDIDWTRVALTQDQVDSNPRLTDLVITKHDNRNKPPREYQAVECEAVGQVTLQRILRETLDGMLPEPLEQVLEREERQRRDALALLHRR